MRVTDYVSQLESIATSGAFDAIKREVASTCLLEIDRGFRTQSDPYGNRWAKRKVRAVREVSPGFFDTWPILYKSGALHDSFVAYPTATGVHFESTSVYAARQNYGDFEGGGYAGGIAPRKMLPSTHSGLGERWTAAINKAFVRHMRVALRAA